MRVRSAAAAAALVATMLVVPASAAHAAPEIVANPAQYVNTIIGTGIGGAVVGSINNFPGPTVPFGMVQYSPDTNDHYAGYQYHQNRIRGFSMNHASAGCNIFGDIPILPTTGDVGDRPWDKTERYSHDDEVTEAGYYAVALADANIRAELTASTRTGLAKFSYPAGTPAQLFVRPGASLAGNSNAKLTVVDSTTLTGSATTGNFCGKGNRYSIYFTMKFDTPFSAHGTWDQSKISHGSDEVTSNRAGGYFTFPNGADLMVRTSVSYVSIDGAEANMEADDVGWDLDGLRGQATAKWDDALGRIGVASSNSKDLEMFYTSLYHSLLHPNTFSDSDGRYMGFDGVVHSVSENPGQQVQYANFSDWDTYRSLAPLQAMIFPKEASDMAQTLVNAAEQSGSLPRWPVANGATGQMTGDNVVPQMVNYYAFGARDFDTATALEYMVKGANDGGKGLGSYVQRPGAAIYNERGYAPQVEEFRGDHRITGASITLEWSVDDFTISRFANWIGEDAIAADFQQRSNNWQNLYNPATKLITPRDAGGAFLASEGGSGFGQEGFDEGNAAQYSWFVPQNVGGLIQAIGGAEAVDSRLDEFTTKTNVGSNEPYLWIGNEPSFQIPWTYNAIGKPWKTQALIDRLMKNHFFPTPDGQPGNDDLGAMASWYVWAAMGSYPFTPGSADLAVNTPVFDRVRVALADGKVLEINAPGASSGKRYIQGMSVNGVTTAKTYIPADIVSDGGVVDYELGSSANTAWGTGADSAQPSYPEGSIPFFAGAGDSLITMSPGSSKVVPIDVQRLAGTAPGFEVRFAASDPGITGSTVAGIFDATGLGSVELPIEVAATVLEGSYEIVATVSSDGKSTTIPIGLQVARPGSFFAALNGVGTAPKANSGVGNFDMAGNSYSREQLAAVNLAPGQAGTVDGLDFTWPDTPVGLPDMVKPEGQVIKLDGVVTRISFVGAAFDGMRSGDATVTFADGSSATTRIAFGDWVIPSDNGDPVEGNSLVAKMADRNATSAHRQAHVFATAPYEAPVGKRIVSITLSNGERLRLFAIASNAAPPVATTTAIGLPDEVASGDDFQVAVHVLPASGPVSELAGEVELLSDGVTQGTSAIIDGSATFSLTAGAAGSYEYTAVFTPTGPEFVASTSAPMTLTVKAKAVESPEIMVSAAAGKVGDSIEVTGSKFTPGDVVTISLNSSPIVMGSAIADATGSFSVTVLVPTGAAVGAHHIVADGATVSAAVPFEVLATVIGPGKPEPGQPGPWEPQPSVSTVPGVGASGGLPVTGAIFGPLLGLSAILLLGGLGLAAFRTVDRRKKWDGPKG